MKQNNNTCFVSWTLIVASVRDSCFSCELSSRGPPTFLEDPGRGSSHDTFSTCVVITLQHGVFTEATELFWIVPSLVLKTSLVENSWKIDLKKEYLPSIASKKQMPVENIHQPNKNKQKNEKKISGSLLSCGCAVEIPHRPWQSWI